MILVVDDDDSLRQLLVKLFLKYGWATSECGDGEVALRLIERTAFDLVLLDKNLPGFDGVEVLRRLRARGETVPVAMMTGYGSVESALETMELGIEAYFIKPFESIQDLVTRAAEIVDRRRQRTGLRLGRAAGRAAGAREPSPAPEAPPAKSDAAAAPAAERPAMALNFVVASPSPVTAQWVGSRILASGGAVRRVDDLAALVREAEDGPADVVLLDAAYEVPALTEAIERLRALVRSPRVLVVGPAPTLEDAAALATAGAGGFLRGPYGHASEFGSTLERLLRRGRS